jgi:hypothetical protein
VEALADVNPIPTRCRKCQKYSISSYYIKYSLQTTTTTPQLLKLLKYGSFPQADARGLGSLDGHAIEAKT